MKKIKVIVILNHKTEKRTLILKDKRDEEILDAELNGILGCIQEFETDKGEIIPSSEILRKV